MGRRNEGIIQSGGHFRAGSVAVGRGATQIVGAPAGSAQEKDQAAAAINDFLKALEVHAAKLKELDELTQTVQQLAEEVRKERPNKLTLKALLEGIKGVVLPVSEMVPAFTTLTRAVMSLLG
jgi:translation initiation factor 2B subunit (eIF-2B alpha/beta/delta family)